MAIVLFGWGEGKARDEGPVVPIACPNCHNAVTFHYVVVKKWFRLYFVPLVPYGTKHYLVCPICRKLYTLEATLRPTALQMAERTRSYSAGELPRERYEASLRSFWNSVRGTTVSAHDRAELPPPS
jgi:hypothetical protein